MDTRQRKRSVGSDEEKSKSSSKVKKVKRIRRRFGSSSSSSASALSSDGRRSVDRWMNKEQTKRYREQIAESEGFDVEDFSGFMGYNMIRQVKGNLEHNREFLKYCSIAMKDYKDNVKQDAKLRFVRMVKANYSIEGSYFDYYITFEAKDTAGDDDEVKTFQALLLVDYIDGEPVQVEFCRLKPTPSTPTP